MALSLRRMAHGQVPSSYKVSPGALAFESINAGKTALILRSENFATRIERCAIPVVISPYRRSPRR
jgi:hypothetical protein